MSNSVFPLFIFPIPFSTCQDPKNNITPCYFSTMSLWRAIHDTIDVVWENIFVILAQNGKRGVGGTERHIVCRLNPSTVVSSFQVFPPPGRMTEKVIHHWSTTAANWISPPPINMQSGLAKVSRKGRGGWPEGGLVLGEQARGACSRPLLPQEVCGGVMLREMGLCWTEASQAWHP